MSCPHEFLGGYRLELDQSWTPLDKINKKDKETAIVDKIISAQLAIGDSPHFQGIDKQFTRTSPNIGELEHGAATSMTN